MNSRLILGKSFPSLVVSSSLIEADLSHHKRSPDGGLQLERREKGGTL